MATNATDNFFRAWFAPDLRLLGYTARPVCLGHLLIFQALNLPFTRLGEPGVAITLDDLLLALRICQHSRFPFREVPIAITRHEARLAMILARREKAFRKAVERFVEWYVECVRGPELFSVEDESSGRACTAPEILTYAVRLTPRFSERRVMTMPVSLVRFYSATIAEQEGANVMFESPALKSAMTQCDELPDLSRMTDEQLYEYTVKQVGEQRARDMQRRRRDAAGGLN